MFMHVWSRRRARGPLAVAAMGAGIGALGGLAFTAIMLGSMSGENISLNEDEATPLMMAVGRVIGPGGLMLVMAVPAFAALGGFLAFRVFNSQEAMYQAMLAQGARPPETKPVLEGRERWPQYAVIATVALIACFILAIAVFVR